MDRKEVEAIKAKIQADYLAKIDKLKEEMKADLAAVSRVAVYFENPSTVSEKPVLRRIANVRASEDKAPNAKDRIIAAKQKLRGKFFRKHLREIIDNDGNGPMKEGTFSPYVSRLIADGEIVEVEKASGTKPASYMWPEDYKETNQESPSTTQDELL